MFSCAYKLVSLSLSSVCHCAVEFQLCVHYAAAAVGCIAMLIGLKQCFFTFFEIFKQILRFFIFKNDSKMALLNIQEKFKIQNDR
jgi:hypothetical protein